MPAATHTPRTWRLATEAPFGAALPALMQDGTLLFHEASTTHWWQLAPDAFGQYDDGTFTQLADAPGDFSPTWNASAVLLDGRYLLQGGEYNGDSNAQVEQTQGAIYDPVAGSWQALGAPTSWTTVGDASGIVLPDGSFMLADCCSSQEAILDPSTLTWTPTGAGKADYNSEESWAQLQDDSILTADAGFESTSADLMRSERYTPSTGMWTSAGDLPVELSDNPRSYEVGPAIARPDGTVVAIGGTPHNALYNEAAQTWTALEDTPSGFATVDGPGVTLPNGDAMFATAPYAPEFAPGTVYYEVSGTTFTSVPTTENAASDPSYVNFLLVLPTGEILHTDSSQLVEIYTPAPGFAANAGPVILDEPTLIGSGAEPPTAPVPTLYRGRSYTLPMQRMNGVDLGAVYGDDVQTSTNYPIVQLTATASGHVWYCRTHDATDRSISPTEVGLATFDIPESVEGGTAQIAAIANGIPSAALTVNVK